jgi:hypothetical protein
MGADSASLLDQCADQREIIEFQEVFGKDRVFANPVSSGVVNEFDDASHNVSRGPEIEPASVSLFPVPYSFFGTKSIESQNGLPLRGRADRSYSRR